MKIAPVVHVEFCSESIHFRAYGALLGGTTVLEALLDRIPTLEDCAPPCVVCCTNKDFANIQRIVEPRGLKVYRQTTEGELNGLYEAGLAAGASTVALIPFGFIFSPPGLLQDMLRHHVESRNDFTIDNGLPGRVAPAILQVNALGQILPLVSSGLSGTAVRAIRRLQELDGSPCTSLPFTLRARSFKFTPPLESEEMTHSIHMGGSEAVEIAVRVVDALGRQQSSSPTAALQTWKRERTAYLGETRRMLERFAGVPDRRRQAAEKIRVLFASTPSAFSGAEQSLCQLVRHLDPCRYEKMMLVGADGIYADTLAGAGAHVEIRGKGFSPPLLDNFLYCMGVLHRMRPDIIHLNGAEGLPLLAAARVLGIPIVMHVRNNHGEEAFEESMRAADALIAISEFTRRWVCCHDVDPAKIAVIHNEVDVNWFHPDFIGRETAREQLGIDKDAKVVSMIARFTPYKRHPLLLDAIARIADRVPRLKVMLTGELYPNNRNSSHTERVKQQARDLGIADRIYWLGFRSEIRVVHSAADVLVLCSDREPLGRCVVEAQAMGVPVVVTNSGGTKEVVRDGETGLVVPGEDPAALAEAIARILLDDQLRTAMSRSARLHAERNLAASVAASRVEEIYTSLLQRCDPISQSEQASGLNGKQYTAALV